VAGLSTAHLEQDFGVAADEHGRAASHGRPA
jgi:hypothetical protein